MGNVTSTYLRQWGVHHSTPLREKEKRVKENGLSPSFLVKKEQSAGCEGVKDGESGRNTLGPGPVGWYMILVAAKMFQHVTVIWVSFYFVSV